MCTGRDVTVVFFSGVDADASGTSEILSVGVTLLNALRRVFDIIDRVSVRAGHVCAWLIAVLILAMVYETLSRYLFNAPTKWAFDISYMLGGTVMLMGMAWVTAQRSQVRVDIIYSRLSARARRIIDGVLNIVFFVPLFFVLLRHSILKAVFSTRINEFSEVGFWRPIIWPYRWMIVVALCLWLLATLSWVVRDVYAAAKGKEL